MLAWATRWAQSPALAALVHAFGGCEEDDDARVWLGRLEEFSERWDFRGGEERNLVAPTEFSAALTEQIFASAEALGLRGANAPVRSHYREVVILGGLVRACLTRPRHAANLLADGSVAVDGVVAIGGFRPLRGNEVELAARFISEEVADEFEAMDAGVRAAFALEGRLDERRQDSDEVGGSWAVREYRTSGELPVRVVAAPSSMPGVRRANTPDTYEWLARESGWVEPGDSLLLVTTDIYRPFQRADALRLLTLPHHIDIDLVGIPPGFGFGDDRLVRPFEPHHYLQEIRSTIRSMRMLYEAADACGRGAAVDGRRGGPA
jgi:hypothetical protein